MNIRQAKNEIKHTVEAYLKKDEAGDYEIPEIRQRPVLLMGPPGIGKTQIMEQIARTRGRAGGIHDHAPHKTERRRTAVHPGGGIRGEDLLCDGVHDE